jgi:hypothetical protein
LSWNVADTLSAAFIVTLQAPVPLHAPPQPAKRNPRSGAALSVTWVPTGKLALQVAPHVIPEGELVTRPLPVRLTDSATGFCANVADTASAAFIVTLQAPVLLHAPPQPVKLHPLAGGWRSARPGARSVY